MSFRETGISSLETVLKRKKNIKVLENNVFISSTNEATVSGLELSVLYKNAIYQIIGDIYNNISLSVILEDVKKNKLWERHRCFDIFAVEIKERDDFIVKPFEVEEGVLECMAIISNGPRKGEKCGSKRTYSYTKQVRSCDEPMSTFAECADCGHKWVYSG